MKDRIKELRVALGLSMESFGAPLGVTRSAISRLESGAVNCTKQMLAAICREYNVNETWLLTGDGEMFNELTRAELAARIVGGALDTDNEFILNTFIALGQLTPAEWKVIEKLIDNIKK